MLLRIWKSLEDKIKSASSATEIQIYVSPWLRCNRSDSPFGRTGTSSQSRDSCKIGATRNSSEHKRIARLAKSENAYLTIVN